MSLFTFAIACIVGGVLLALIGVGGLLRARCLDWIAGFEETINTAVTTGLAFKAAPHWTGTTMVIPIVPGRPQANDDTVVIPLPDPPDWDVRRADFAAYIEQAEAAARTLAVARRSRAIDAARTLTRPALTSIARPTQEFRRIVAHTTGQTLTEVGPREAEIQGRRLVWTEQGWKRDALMEMTT